jgi:regulator of replication initiation timing
MQKRAAAQVDEIETLTNALSDMSALDYTVKKMIEGELRMDKEEFRKRLTHARLSQYASDEEINLLFKALDCHKDDYLTKDDFDVTKVGTTK